MCAQRTETDFIGQRILPAEALYGIHSLRACDNFPIRSPFAEEWYRAVGLVKLAVYNTYARFVQQIERQNLSHQTHLNLMDAATIQALQQAASEVAQGLHFEHFLVPALQGGAGTSINLNVNEIVANRALQILGYRPGDYARIDPIEQANVFQSTNDVVPTALTLAAMEGLEGLEKEINHLRQHIERYETQHRHTLRIAYTQLQAAVPSTFGKLFSAYNDALSRDWWRVSKCFERIKVVNLGGGAIGTSLAIPRFFVMELVPSLQSLCTQPIARGENLVDTTSNLDNYVEVHATLKAHATNLEKIASDLRLLASDLHQSHELRLPAKQVGSSIMPGKVNPVIVEFVVSAAHKVYANDALLGHLAGQGMLELNAYLPAMGDALLESLRLLRAANQSLRLHIFDQLQVDAEMAQQQLFFNPSVCTALAPVIGYHQAAQLARLMQTEHLSVQQANERMQCLDNKLLETLLQPAQLLRAGFSIHDTLGQHTA